MLRRTALLVALLGMWTLVRAADVVTVYRADDAGGSIFDSGVPRKGPKECWVTVFDTGHGKLMTVVTDQPFRADKAEEYIPGTGPRFKAISFMLPAAPTEGSAGTTSPDEGGYVVKSVPEPKSKYLDQGSGTRLIVEYDGPKGDIERDGAEIVVTPDMVPAYVKVESLTRERTLNKKSKLTCEKFSKVEARGVASEATAEGTPGGPAAGAPGSAGPQETFWQSLHALCGKAFAHVQDPPVPTTPVLDVRKCDDASVTFGVHYLVGGDPGKWNRSQTWVISKTDGGLRMDYTQTQSPDPAAKRSGWSAATKDAGGADLQVFLPDPKTVETIPALAKFGWVLRIQGATPGPPTLLYQAIEKTDAGEQAKGGYLFDLATPIDPPEQPPWGLTAAPPAEAPPAQPPPAPPAQAEPAPPAQAEPAPAPQAPAPAEPPAPKPQ